MVARWGLFACAELLSQCHLGKLHCASNGVSECFIHFWSEWSCEHCQRVAVPVHTIEHERLYAVTLQAVKQQTYRRSLRNSEVVIVVKFSESHVMPAA